MSLVSLARKNLKRHRIRSFLTVLGIAVAAMTLFLILSFNGGYDQALSEEMKSSGVQLYISMEGCPMQAASLILHGGEIPSYLEQSMLDNTKALPEVRTAGGMLISTVISGGRADLFYGITDEVEDLKPNWELDGTWFKGPDSVILGYDLARDNNKIPGDKIYIKSVEREFKVSGVLSKSGNEDDGFYFLPLETAQEIFSKPKKLTVIGVQLKDPTKVQQAKIELERRGAYVIPVSDITDLISSLVGSTKAVLFGIVGVIMMLTCLGVFNTVLMATFERNREFGYLRCVGAQKRHIFSLILLETGFLAAAGLFVGTIAGYGLSFLLDGWIRRFLPYAPAGSLLRPDILAILVTAAVVLLTGMIAGLYPGCRASNVPPMEAIRND